MLPEKYHGTDGEELAVLLHKNAIGHPPGTMDRKDARDGTGIPNRHVVTINVNPGLRILIRGSTADA